MASKFITISIEIMHDKNLTPNQKFILAEIMQLSSLENGCFAQNSHFSKLIGVSKQAVSNAINDLAKKGYIEIDNTNTKRNYGRVIAIHENVPLYTEMYGRTRECTPIHENVETKGNIHSNIQLNIQKNKETPSASFQNIHNEFDIDEKFTDEIQKHRKESGHKKATAKAMKQILTGMRRTVDRNIMTDLNSCLRYMVDETTWQSFKPEYLKSIKNPIVPQNETIKEASDRLDKIARQHTEQMKNINFFGE